MTSFGPKVGQIGTKWDKSGTFPDQISIHFDSAKCHEIWSEKVLDLSHTSQNVLKSDLKKSRICPILGLYDPLWAQIWPFCSKLRGCGDTVSSNSTQNLHEICAGCWLLSLYPGWYTLHCLPYTKFTLVVYDIQYNLSW